MEQLIAGRYQLGERIGAGGAAVVYRARDTRLDRDVAVKLLREELASDIELLTRLQQEARLAASLNHPNVVDVYDHGTHGDTAFIVMQYVPGGNLKDRIRQQGALEPRQAIEVAEQVLSALSAAHLRGLVHRDVKPQNVLVAPDGRAMLTDFGIAQAAAGGELTQVGMTVGSAAYIAPEQALGGRVGPPADIYGVGLLLYEMLAGQPPFGSGTPVEVAFRQVNETPRPPSDIRAGIPRQLEAIVLRALEKDPLQRYPTAEAMLQALEGVPLVASSDETTRMATVRMPRAEPAYNATARTPVAPPSAMTAAPRRSAATTLILALGLVGLLAVCGLIAALAAQGSGFLGGGAPSPGAKPGASVTPAGISLVPVTATKPSATAAPPTQPPAPASPTPAPSATPAPPTATAPPPTVTQPPPTATAVPFTPTTPPPPTATGTVGLRPIPTATLVPPPTPTLPPPAPIATPKPAATPPPKPVAAADVVIQSSAFQGGAQEANHGGRNAVVLYGARTQFARATARFDLPGAPREAELKIVGRDSRGQRETSIAIFLNDAEVFRGDNPFPDGQWTERRWQLQQGMLRQGANTLTIQNLENTDRVGQPPSLAVEQVIVRYAL